MLEWLAAQLWCDGRVGMFGTSWGGTAGLQASVDVPEALAMRNLHPDDPLTARSTFDHRIVCDRPDGTALVGCRVAASSTETQFRLEGRLTAVWDGELVSERRWDISLDRRYTATRRVEQRRCGPGTG